MASRKAIRDEQKAQPGSLLDLLMIAGWLIAACAVVAACLLWPGPYDAAREVWVGLAVIYAAGGLITAMLIDAVGRIIRLLEVIAAKKA
jgi:hypothetical protein